MVELDRKKGKNEDDELTLGGGEKDKFQIMRNEKVDRDERGQILK